jgi:hypothetical protein
VTKAVYNFTGSHYVIVCPVTPPKPPYDPNHKRNFA